MHTAILLKKIAEFFIETNRTELAELVSQEIKRESIDEVIEEPEYLNENLQTIFEKHVKQKCRQSLRKQNSRKSKTALSPNSKRKKNTESNHIQNENINQKVQNESNYEALSKEESIDKSYFNSTPINEKNMQKFNNRISNIENLSQDKTNTDEVTNKNETAGDVTLESDNEYKTSHDINKESECIESYNDTTEKEVTYEETIEPNNGGSCAENKRNESTEYHNSHKEYSNKDEFEKALNKFRNEIKNSNESIDPRQNAVFLSTNVSEDYINLEKMETGEDFDNMIDDYYKIIAPASQSLASNSKEKELNIITQGKEVDSDEDLFDKVENVDEDKVEENENDVEIIEDKLNISIEKIDIDDEGEDEEIDCEKLEKRNIDLDDEPELNYKKRRTIDCEVDVDNVKVIEEMDEHDIAKLNDDDDFEVLEEMNESDMDKVDENDNIEINDKDPIINKTPKKTKHYNPLVFFNENKRQDFEKRVLTNHGWIIWPSSISVTKFRKYTENDLEEIIDDYNEMRQDKSSERLFSDQYKSTKTNLITNCLYFMVERDLLISAYHINKKLHMFIKKSEFNDITALTNLGLDMEIYRQLLWNKTVGPAKSPWWCAEAEPKAIKDLLEMAIEDVDRLIKRGPILETSKNETKRRISSTISQSNKSKSRTTYSVDIDVSDLSSIEE